MGHEEAKHGQPRVADIESVEKCDMIIYVVVRVVEAGHLPFFSNYCHT